MRAAAAVLLAAVASSAAAQEDQWTCGTDATIGQRSLCAVLAPVVLVWPAATLVAHGATTAYTGACGEPFAPGWSVEEFGVRPAYEGQWYYQCTGDRIGPQPTPQ